MTSHRVLDLACAYDDEHPDHICPGCGVDITGWENHPAHYSVPITSLTRGQRNYLRTAASPPWPFRHIPDLTNTDGYVCPWQHDYLIARRYRRHLLNPTTHNPLAPPTTTPPHTPTTTTNPNTNPT